MREKSKIKLERSYRMSIDDLWNLWTTKEGIESWWGPEGFKTKVHKLDLRPGGEIQYTMFPVAPEQIKFMEESGMDPEHNVRHRYDEIVPKRRLVQTHRVDFIPGVKPYEVQPSVEFQESGPEVRMIITIDPMHSEEWTERVKVLYPSVRKIL